MASIEDRWHVERTQRDGSFKRSRSARYGKGRRWLLRWRDEAGTPRARSFDRKAEADRLRIEVEGNLSRGTYRDPDAGSETFRIFAERWRVAQFDDPATAATVETRFRLHVYPALGGIPLARISPSTIRDWVHSLKMARSYQETIFKNVSQVLNAAVADDVIRTNPCRSPTVRKPKADPRQVVPWEHAWVAGLRDELPQRYKILADLAAAAGLRQGEVFGLGPRDIDFDNEIINVRRQVKLSHGNYPYLAPPKGRKTRTVPMPPTLANALRSYLEAFPAQSVTLPWDVPDGRRVVEQLVLTSREHKAMNRNYFNSRIWKPALARAGIPTTRENGCHALRHFYASVLLDGGESIKTVSDRLGHADPAFTLRTYTHLLPNRESRTKAIIEAAFDRFGDRPPPSRAPDVHQTPGQAL